MKNSLRNSSSLPLGTSLGLALLCAPALAGDKVLPGPSVSLWRSSVGLESRGDHLHGGGADYKARFDAQGFAYVPALGRAVESEMPLSFELVSAGREGGPALELALGVAPEAVGNSAIYARGSGLTERYDLRGDGVEQSFVLAERPAGAGDLVVRGRIETPLAHSDAAVGLLFGSAEIGGVRIGAVEGIDAAGARAAGSLGMTGDLLELRLPAAFVDAAAYPLVLDPLFGTSFGVSTTANDDLDPDVASEASLNMFLFVWQREFSASSAEIRAQRIDTNSVPQGSTLFLSSGGVNLKPSVGDNTTSNVFLVAWQSGSSIFGPFDILCRQVDGATGVLSTTTLTVTSETWSETDACVGGDQIKHLVTDQQEQLVVWSDDDFGVSGAQVRAPIGGEPSVLSTFTAAFNPFSAEIRRPSISKIGGGDGLYLLVWQEKDLFEDDIDVLGRLVDRNGVLIGGVVAIASSAVDETDPAVASMPAQAVFVVAYEVLEPDGVGHDVYARSMSVNGGVLQPLAGPIAVEAELGDEEFDPAVCCPGGKAWVAYCDQSTDLTSTLRVEAFDPFDLVKCEDVVFAQPTGIAQEPAMTLLYGGSFGGPLTMLTWGSLDPDPPFVGDVHAQLLLSHAGTGTATSLGGACGGGGTLSGSGTPDIGSGMFQLNCTGIDPLAVLAILNISAPTAPIACGACAWVPFSLTVTQGTGGTGSAAYIPLIPCDPLLIGAQVDTQYTSVFTASTPCPLFANVSVSNIVRLTIGQ